MTRDDPEPADVRARLARARASGNPDHLWPTVSRTRRVESARRLGAAVVDGLAGRRAVVADGDPEAAGIAAFVMGVGPLLGRWLADGTVQARGAVGHELALQLQASRERATRLAGGTVVWVTRLRALGIEPVVLKGQHLAALYPEPGARTQSDIDLWLPEAARATVERVLRAEQWTPLHTDDAGRRATWGPPDGRPPRRLDRISADDPWTLDVHWTLDRGTAAGPIQGADWATAARSTVSLAGVPITVLAEGDLAWTTVLHTALGFDDLQTSRLVDLVYLGRAVPDAWAQAADAAAARGAPHVLWPAVALVERVAPGAIPSFVVEGARAAAPAWMRRVVADADPATKLIDDRRTLRQKFMWARGPADWMRVGWNLMANTNATAWRRRLRLLRERA